MKGRRMGNLEIVTLTGKSGTCYDLLVLPVGTPLAAIGAVYSVLRDGPSCGTWERRSLIRRKSPSEGRQWSVLYIGQTNDLDARFENAHVDQELARIRATHIAILGAASEPQRRSIEFDLVHHYASLLTRAVPFNRQCLVESLTIAPCSA